MGYDSAAILRHAEFALQNTTDSFRIEVLNTMISIVKGVQSEKSSTNS